MKRFAIYCPSRETMQILGDCIKAHFGIYQVRRYSDGTYIVDVGVDNVIQKMAILMEYRRVKKMQREETVIDITRFIPREKNSVYNSRN